MPKGQLHSVQGDGLEWNEELRKAYAELEADPSERRYQKRKLREGRSKNVAESQFAGRMVKQGWAVTRRGWPDFFLERDGEILLVEVKANSDIPLRDSQLRIAQLLKKYGVPVRRWSPDVGFEEIPDIGGSNGETS